MAMAGEYPDMVIACFGGGSNFGHESGKGILLILKRPHAEKRLPAPDAINASRHHQIAINFAAPSVQINSGSGNRHCCTIGDYGNDDLDVTSNGKYLFRT